MILPFSKNPNQSRNLAIGLGISLIIIGVYNALFFNRYLPFTEGWFSVYAHYILDGATPYKDFHFFLPPLYPGILAVFTYIFGASFLALRILGIAVTLSITAMLFLLYARLFPAYIACVVAIVSTIYWQSNVAFIGYNFISFLHLFALMGTFFICKYYDYDDHSLKSGKGRTASAFLFCAGLFGALVFLTKQSDGFFVLLFSFLAVAISAYAKEGLRKALRSISIYSAGILIPMLVLLIWLLSNGVLVSFWNQVFAGASSSKGGLTAILFNWIPRLFTLENVGGLVVAVLIIITLRIYCFPQGFALDRLEDRKYKKRFLLSSRMLPIFSLILILFGLCVLLPFWDISFSHELNENQILNFIYYRILLIIGFTGSLLLFCVFLFKVIREKKSSYFDIFIISTISLGILWSTSTSAAIGDMGMILALGLLLGCLSFIPSYFNLTKIAVLIFCAFLILFCASQKYIHPYYWWGLTQPDIRTTSTQVDSKYLDGFILSEQTARVYSEVTSIVETYTEPGDNIYTFPNIPIFYLLTDRYPSTFSIVSWFDVLPDNLAVSEAKHISESPPKVIIYLDVPEFVWEAHEQMFRNGEMSGQRKIKEAIEDITSSGNYVREAKFDLGNGYTLSIWRTWRIGIDVSTSLTDKDMGNDITVVGDFYISTDEKKFGTASGYFDGTGDYLSVANSADWDFGSDDFTIDGWFYFNANNKGNQFMVDRRSDADRTGWVFYLESDNSLSFLSASATDWDNGVLWDTGVVPETGKWIHLAVIRNGNVFTMYQNGNAIKSGTYTGSIGAQTVAPTIGAGHVVPYTQGFDGYIDELRISNGIARWKADFIPPAVPYDIDPFTKLLLHFDTITTDAAAPTITPGVEAGD